ncbi:MAG: metal ABC transporter substrate-binding protein [Planctomycetota bacterium]
MKRKFRPLELLLLTIALSSAAADKALNVMTTIPDLADIAREIGGHAITVESIVSGTDDIHAVSVRPSLVAKLARADAVIEIGLDLEHSFLPSLVEAANNPKLKREGRIVVSEGMIPKDVPTVISRAEGEQHPEGNPHMNVGPDSGKRFAKNICARLCELAPGNESLFKANLKTYLAKVADKEKEWKAKGAKLKGVKFVTYHPDFVYFSDYFGMESVGTLEPKPGIPPSASHTAQIITRLKEINGTKLILREPQYSDALPTAIAAQTGAKVVKIAIMVDGLPEAKTWIGMIDANLEAIIKALE